MGMPEPTAPGGIGIKSTALGCLTRSLVTLTIFTCVAPITGIPGSIQTAQASVDRVGSWSGETLFATNGFNYTPGAGTNRVVIVMFTAESTTSPVANVGSVTLGGQALTAIQNADGVVVGDAGGYHNFIWMGYLRESGIAAMAGNALNITWDTTPNQPDGGEVKVQAATYQNVDQSTPIADSASNTNASTSTIQAGNVSVGTGDRVVYGTVHGNVQDHTAPAGYTEQIEQDGPGSDHSNASVQRDATTAGTVNPTATWGTSWRTAIISVVLDATCYYETYQSWTATSADTWQTQTLSGAPYNVPAGAVVEVAVRNHDCDEQLWGGVRAVGSTLERRFQLHEAEEGNECDEGANGEDHVVMHVQTDGSSRIQHYSDATATVDFVLLGYWECGSYVEAYDTFTAGASGSWQDEALCSHGVGPASVVEIVMTNDDLNFEREAGVRTNGSGLERRVDLHEAEGGGVDAVSMFVKVDSTPSATIELYAEDDADVDFYLVGYWSTPPGAYDELFTDVGSPASDATWQDLDLTASGVPDSTIAEFVLANEFATDNNNIGVRTNGSSLGRLLDLQEAEDGGGDYGRMHVPADNSATIEFYFADVSDTHSFFLVGYWDACDPSIEYIVSDLGAITAANESLGQHINNSAKVAGFEDDASGDPDGWFSDCGTFKAIGVLGGSNAEAYGINDNDVVVGWSDDGSGNRRAVTWTDGGGLTDLGTDDGRADSEALSINGNDEVVGTVLDYGMPNEANRLAFIYLPVPAYSQGSGMSTIGTLGGEESVAMDINDAGQVVGGAEIASGHFRPFRWASGTMTNLGTLGGEVVTVDHRAEAINSSGNVCGRSYTAGGAAHAFYYNGSMTDLGVLTGGTESWAFGINDSDVVVGTSDTTGSVYRAVVWDATNGLRNLNNLIPTGTGWTLIRATDINNNGFITGWGTNGSGDVRAFLLTPSCSAGGGGSARSIMLAKGSGVTDGQGTFFDALVDTEGRELATVDLFNPEAGIKIDYQVVEPQGVSDSGSGLDTRNRTGFADGVAHPRTLTVATTAIQPGSSLLVSILLDNEEIAELPATTIDLQLHVLDASGGEGFEVWVPAGRDVGEAEPTAITGESGHLIYADGSVEYWAVRASGGTFAVGWPETHEPDEEPNSGAGNSGGGTVPRLCGIAMIQPFAVCLGALWFSRRRRHSTLKCGRTPTQKPGRRLKACSNIAGGKRSAAHGYDRPAFQAGNESECECVSSMCSPGVRLASEVTRYLDSSATAGNVI